MGFRLLVSGEVDPRRRKHCVPAGDPRVGYLRIVDAGGEAYGTEADMGRLLDMLTRCPARVVYGRAAGEHGVETGCRADLVVLEARTLAEAVGAVPARRWVVKAGRVTVDRHAI